MTAHAAYCATRTVPLDELTPFPGNAKRGDVQAILSSLRRNGQYRSLVVREIPNGPLIVLAGNHTLQALAAHGPGTCQAQRDALEALAAGEQAKECALCRDGGFDQTARCEIVSCDDATARRINLADNRTAELGSYDDAALTELLTALDGDYDGTGYAPESLDALLADIEDLPPALDDPDDVPDAPTVPLSALGDVWQLGPHRLLCGDATDVAAVEAMLLGGRCDCMWTDPPYGVQYVGKTVDALTIQNDGADDLPDLLAGAFAVATVALKPGAAIYVATPPGPLHFEFARAFQTAGWLLRQNLVWVKDVLVLGRSDYHYRHEPLLYGFTDGGEGRLGRGGERWYGDNTATSVFEIPKPTRSADHPTMKPVDLVKRCLTNSCPPGGLVYEPFGGSGTTLIAAHATGRKARVVELDPRYVDVICRRFQQATGIQPVLEATGQAHDFE